MQTYHDRWIFEIPLDAVQNDNIDTIKGKKPCLLCGKEVKNEVYNVHLLTSGNLVSTSEPFEVKEDQGFFPIGSECKNRLPNNFYFKIV